VTGVVDGEEVLARFPRVRLDADNVAHYRGLLEHRLLLNRCADCRTWHHPPRPVCPRCWSREVVAEAVSGRGEIAFVTFLHQGPRAPGVDYEGGWPVAAVELVEQEGLRYAASIVDSPRDRIGVGAPVELVWLERDGEPVAAFTVTTSSAPADDPGDAGDAAP
jgi:uncharacterized OB-fold protein